MLKKSILLLLALIVAVTSIGGCGGGTLTGANVIIRLERNRSSDNMNDLVLIISPNDGASTSLNAADDFTTQSWIEEFSRGSAAKQVRFRTDSNRIGYRVYVHRDFPGGEVQARIVVTMDGVEKYRSPVLFITNSDPTSAQFLINILQQNVQN